MASFSFNWIGENWFQKPPDPVTPINLLNFGQSLQQHKRLPNFASISGSFFGKSKPPQSKPKPQGMHKQMLEQYFWECEKDPDYRHTPEVEDILAREKGENLSHEEIEERNRRSDELKQSPVAQFLFRAEEIADKINEMELEQNAVPYRKEDRKLWEKLPHVIGPDGRPMPRKAIKTRNQSDDKFWDFARQFFFGLWGFRQRPYPPGRPIDVAQAIGYKQLEKRYYDFIMRSGGLYYKDRLGRTRGPLELITLKTAWAGGIIDTDTFIWGEDMDEWAPIGMVYGLQEAIATWEVRLGAAATAFIHKLQKGIPPWVPLKGHERKTYKQLQEEAIESKRRDLAVLEANGGVWPGVRIPSHALFLWASGPELTSILEKDHMPNKFIPKDLRKKLASAIPGLRPWEILSLEQAMDQITYGGEWYREPLGSYTTGPPYIRHWNRDVKRMFRIFYNLSYRVYNKLERIIPGFGSVVERVQSEAAERHARRKERREAESRAIIEAGFYDRRSSD